MKEHNDGFLGWVATALVVAIWDVFAIKRGHQTMSAAYAKALQRNRRTRLIVGGSTAYLVCHLIRWPSGLARHDPLRVVAGALHD
jgi:hypothetical protein